MALGPWITEDDKQAVMRELDAGNLLSGKRVEEFEGALAVYLGKRHVVCVSSGTAALECAYWATGEGYELRIENYIAAMSAARAVIKREPRSVPWATANGAAILGMAPEYYGRRVLDCAHAFGTKALPGDVHTYSCNVNKPICCLGGIIATDDSVVAAKCRQYRNHGRDGSQQVFSEGRNHRMSELSAGLGLCQLARIDEILARRKQVAKWYDLALAKNLAETRTTWFLYPVLCKTENHGHRSLADFRLFNSATSEDRCTALLPVWALMTEADVQAVTKPLAKLVA